MNRRNFISKSSLAILAAAGLPKAVFSKPSTMGEMYKTELQSGVANQYYYELIINHLGFRYFDTAKSDEKEITLKAAYFETSDITKPTKSSEFTYIMKEAAQTSKDADRWYIKAKFDKKETGDFKLPKDFPKDLILSGVPLSYFDIMSKKEEILVHVPYPTTSSDDYDGCFLTTACVGNKQLADDCDELNTLRFLRDTYMKQDAEGIVLAKNYKIIGPKIVQAINRLDNKGEIYNYMYDHLVTPSVKLIKAKEYAAATEYYRDFVVGLEKKYL